MIFIEGGGGNFQRLIIAQRRVDKKVWSTFFWGLQLHSHKVSFESVFFFFILFILSPKPTSPPDYQPAM